MQQRRGLAAIAVLAGFTPQTLASTGRHVPVVRWGSFVHPSKGGITKDEGRSFRCTRPRTGQTLVCLLLVPGPGRRTLQGEKPPTIEKVKKSSSAGHPPVRSG